MLGGWLLESLELSTAYTGKLLYMMAASRRAEIDSVDELVYWGLPMIVTSRLKLDAVAGQDLLASEDFVF